MHGVRQALDEMMPCFVARDFEQIPIEGALGRVLAEPAVASADQPPFDNSAMDGYAVLHADLGEGSLTVAGESRAGDGPSKLSRGHAMRIFTGAPVPVGADTVIMQENAERDGDRVRFTSEPAAGANIRRRGSDLATGAVAVPAAVGLGAGELALLAAQDRARITVYRRPRVAIVCTGDELREVGSADRPGSIVNSNAHALAAQVRDTGGEPWVLPPAKDDVEVITSTLREALSADLVISVGGVSVGDHDHVAGAFERAGIERRFWKVAVKPGKPLLFAMGGDTPVVGLPGNPISAMVTFEVFVRPGLRRMAGHALAFAAPIPVTLGHAHRHSTGRLEFARARLKARPDGWVADLHALQGSGSLPSMVGVDALLMLGAEQEVFEAGAPLLALPLRPPLYQDGPPVDREGALR